MTNQLTTLAEQFGTPLYVYDLDQVEAAHSTLTAALPTPHRLLYSLKANPLPDLAARLCLLGCAAEVSSAGEIAAALHAGFQPDDLLFTGPAKRPTDLNHAVAAGCLYYSIESPLDMQRVHAAATTSHVHVRGLIRVNIDQRHPGVPLAFGGPGSPFGTELSQILAAPEVFASTEHLQIAGTHMFLASNIHDESALLHTLTLAAQAAAKLAKAGVPLTVVDLGGGFGAPYARAGPPPTFPNLSTELANALDRTLPGWRAEHPAIWFEAGRYLAGPAGTLLVRVMDIKDHAGRRTIITDSGIHHLGGMSGLRRLAPLHLQPLTATLCQGNTDNPARVVGQLCTPLDCWAPAAVLPTSLEPGDLLVVPNVGAYGPTASLLAFLSHPAPLEITLHRGQVVGSTRLEIGRQPHTIHT